MKTLISIILTTLSIIIIIFMFNNVQFEETSTLEPLSYPQNCDPQLEDMFPSFDYGDIPLNLQEGGTIDDELTFTFLEGLEAEMELNEALGGLKPSSKKQYSPTQKLFNEFIEFTGRETNESSVKLFLKCLNTPRDRAPTIGIRKFCKGIPARNLHSLFSHVKRIVPLLTSNAKRISAFIKKLLDLGEVKKARVFAKRVVELLKTLVLDGKDLLSQLIFLIGIAACMRSKELFDLLFSKVTFVVRQVPLYLNQYNDEFINWCNAFDISIEFIRSKSKNKDRVLLTDFHQKRVFLSYWNKFGVQDRNGHLFKCWKYNKFQTSINCSLKYVYNVSKDVARICGIATGINAACYTGHTIRRTAATLFVQNGGNLQQLMKWGDWKSPHIAQSYIDDTVELRREFSNIVNK